MSRGCRDDEAALEAGKVVESYRQGEDVEEIALYLARLREAYGAWRVKCHLARFGLLELAVRTGAQAAVESRSSNEALPHFYLALDNHEDPQDVRDAFFRAGLELVDLRRELLASPV